MPSLKLSVLSTNGNTLEKRDAPEGSHRVFTKVFSESGGVIGRESGQDSTIWGVPDPDQFVSQKHCLIQFQSGQFYVIDVSSNGTWLNDSEHPLPRGEPVLLKDGDLLKLCWVQIRVQWVPDPSFASIEEALLQGLGLQRALNQQQTISFQDAYKLGQVVRQSTEFLMVLLELRSNVLEAIRLTITEVQSDDNNPLKCFQGEESVTQVLETLFIQSKPGFLSSEEAFFLASKDIVTHHKALLSGVKAGFESMLRAFSPDGLHQRIQSSHVAHQVTKNSLPKWLGGDAKWEAYRRFYESLLDDPDQTYQSVFGKAFKEGYFRESGDLC